MLEKLQDLETKYEQLTEMMSKEEVLNNPAELQKCAKAQADLEDIVVAYREYKKVREDLSYSKEMLAEKLDPEMEEMVKAEIKELSEKEEESLGSEAFDNIYNLFSILLCMILKRQIKKGMYKDYNDFKDEINTIRGKINLNDSINNDSIVKKKIVCEYD